MAWRDDGEMYIDEATGMPVPKSWLTQPGPPQPSTDLPTLVGLTPGKGGVELPGAAQAPGAFQPTQPPPPAANAFTGAGIAGQPAPPPKPAAPSRIAASGMGGGIGEQAATAPKPAQPQAEEAISDPYAAADASLARQGAVEARRADARANGLDTAAQENQAAVRRIADMQAKATEAAKLDFDALKAEAAQIDKDLPEEGLSTGQRVGFAIAAVLDGALNPTGKNGAVEVMQGTIDQKAKSRAAELAKRRAVLADKTGAAKDSASLAQQEIAAQDLIRVQEYDAALKQIDADIAQYDSPIVREKLTQTRADLLTKRDEAQARAGQQLFENKFKVMSLEEEQRQAKSREAQGWKQIKNQEKQFEQNLLLKAAELEQQGQGAAAQAARQQAQTAIFGKNGEVIATAPDAETARPLRAGISAATKMTAALDEISALYNKSGGEISALNSDEKQRMEALHGQLILLAKDKDKLGALAGADLELIYKNLGEDPTSFFSNQARWKQTRALIEDGVNYDLQTQTGYKGPRWTAPVDTRIEGMQTPGKAAQPIVPSHERDRMKQEMLRLGLDDQVIRGADEAEYLTSEQQKQADEKTRRREEINNIYK